MEEKYIVDIQNQIKACKSIKEILDIMPHETFYSYMKKCNEKHPDYIAINYLGRKITFKELDEKITYVADSLLALGVKPGDYVITSPMDTPEGIISIYAINKIGAIVHLINPQMGKGEIKKHIKDTNSKVAFIYDIFYTKEMQDAYNEAGIKRTIMMHLNDSLPFGLNADKIKINLASFLKGNKDVIRSYPLVKDIRTALCFGTFPIIMNFNDLLKCGKEINANYTHPYEEGKTATIAYTSGSTGASKGVCATDLAINSVVLTNIATLPVIKEQDGAYSTLPYWINYSFLNSMHEPLCLSVTCELDPLFDEKNIAKRFKEYKFNHWNTIPYYVEKAFDEKLLKNTNLSSLKTLFTGGDYLNPEVKKKADKIIKENKGTIEIGQGYGLSETLCGFSMQYGNYKTGSSGKLLLGNKVKILDPENGLELPKGSQGELFLASPTLMKEYYNDPVETKNAIIEDEEGTRWFRTGDIGKINEDDELEMVGRIRRIVITVGEDGLPSKLIPDKIKKILCEYPGVIKAEVIGIDHPERITVPVAFIELDKNKDFSSSFEENLKNYCIEMLPNYMVPVKIIALDKIPLKPSLKPDLDALKELYNTSYSRILKK